MIAKKELFAALNQQIEFCLAASYLYLQMTEWLEKKGLIEAGCLMRTRAREETHTAMALFNHLLHGGIEITLGRLAVNKRGFASGRELYRVFRRNEKLLESCARELKVLALAAGDSRAWVLLNKSARGFASDGRMERMLNAFDIANRRQGEKAGGSGGKFRHEAEVPEAALREVS